MLQDLEGEAERGKTMTNKKMMAIKPMIRRFLNN